VDTDLGNNQMNKTVALEAIVKDNKTYVNKDDLLKWLTESKSKTADVSQLGVFQFIIDVLIEAELKEKAK
jgi:hypothetical protein